MDRETEETIDLTSSIMSLTAKQTTFSDRDQFGRHHIIGMPIFSPLVARMQILGSGETQLEAMREASKRLETTRPRST
jgi:hypothetical protein